MIKVCHISTVHNAFDDRIFHKECVSLAKAGFDITLIVKHDKNEVVDGVKISALLNKSSRSYRIISQFIAFSKAIKVKAGVYHFHDPELMLIGVLLRLFGKKVIYDVHEDIVKQVYYKKWIKFTFIRAMLSKIIKYLEKFCSLFFVKIVVVTDDIAVKFPPKKTILIRNYPIIELIDNQPINNSKVENTIRLIYAGGLTEVRGIKEIIASLEFISQDIELLLLGPWESEEYMQECKNINSWNKVKYLGMLNLEDVYPYIKSSDIGLSLLYPAKNYITSLPVKAFEYMACEKPMIMSNFDYWKEIFGGVALFCDPMNSKEIALCIQQLIDDKFKAQELGKKGRKLILEKFSWEAESLRLVEMYHGLSKNKQ
ncbi:MAG: glycosyltransferase family 4 protein [Bacteroidota bacterium]